MLYKILIQFFFFASHSEITFHCIKLCTWLTEEETRTTVKGCTSSPSSVEFSSIFNTIGFLLFSCWSVFEVVFCWCLKRISSILFRNFKPSDEIWFLTFWLWLPPLVLPNIILLGASGIELNLVVVVSVKLGMILGVDRMILCRVRYKFPEF